MRIASHMTVALGAFLVTATAAAQERNPEVANHTHGTSVLRIAVDGNNLTINFEAPGLEIVGFERVPATPEETAAVERATQTLRDPLRIFDFGTAAGCTIASAEVEFITAEGAAAGGEPPAAPPPGDVAAAPAPGAEEVITNHAEFQATYSVTCTNVAAVTQVFVRMFQMFPNSTAVQLQRPDETTIDIQRPAVVVPLPGGL
jgi:hypothetical protein